MAFKSVIDVEGNPIRLGGTDKSGKPNPKTITGYYIGSKGVSTKYGPATIHVFQTKDGEVPVWGKTDMDRKLKTITPGFLTRVTFTGTVPSKKGNDMWKYNVEADAENTIEVAAVTPSAEEEHYAEDLDEEQDVDAEEAPLDEIPVARPKAPAKVATTPSLERQQQVQNLLKGRKVS